MRQEKELAIRKAKRIINKLGSTILLGLLILLANSTQAQSRENEEDQDGFFNEMDKENFKSDFGNDQGSRSIDYSRDHSGNREGQSKSYEIFSEKGNMPEYKFEEGDNNSTQGRNQGGMIIQGGENGVGPELKQPGNASIPSIPDPFKQGQTGVKAPRNMDAVPDNGDEPNDVPLDGGIGILALAAGAWGMRKKR